MNEQLRHVVHIMIGKELAALAPALRIYIDKYGDQETAQYLQVLSCTQAQADGIDLRRHTCFEADDMDFMSSLDYRYQVREDLSGDGLNDAQVVQYFTNLFNRTVTIDNPGATGEMYVCLYVPLYDKALWGIAKRLISCLSDSKKRIRIDAFCMPAEMSVILCEDEDRRKLLPGQLNELRVLAKSIAQEVIDTPELHRFMLFEDCNSKGLALNLDGDGLVRIAGEVALLTCENYQTLFPVSQVAQRIDVTSFGIAVLAFDKVYFVNYLLCKAYLHILEREKIGTEEKVSVNKASLVAQKMLKGGLHLYGDLKDETLEPLLAQRHNAGFFDSDIPALESDLKKRIETATSEMLSFIDDPELSLNEKQAILAMILGEDDPLLDGVQYYKNQSVLDDCDRESLQLFLDEDNRDAEKCVLPGPKTEDGKIWLPIDEIRLLRSRIRQMTEYIRKKESELEKIDIQKDVAEENHKRLSDDGFEFGGNKYKLLPSTDNVSLFEETYTAHKVTDDSIDLRGAFTAVKSQGSLGACSAFAMVSIFEYIMKKNSAVMPDMSEAFVYYNARKSCTDDGDIISDNGSSFYDVAETMCHDGVVSEKVWPYTETLDAPSAEAYEEAKGRIVKVVKNVKVSHSDITSALSDGYPVAISLRLFDSFEADRHGFVMRPSKSEIAAGDSGNHAMVVCGFSNSEKVYIVRNSWGKKFGDAGYCYIPFSYIDDPRLCNQACIITGIAVGEEFDVMGYDKKRNVSFNMADDGIRAAIIRILVDEERVELDEDNRMYVKLRYEYEKLLQTLSNPSKRDEIYDNAIVDLSARIDKARKDYAEFVRVTRPARIEEFKLKHLNVKVWLVTSCIINTLSFGLSVYYGFTETSFWLGIVLALMVVFIVLYFWKYNHDLSILIHELDKLAAEIKTSQARLEKERTEKHVRLHLAGIMVSELTDLKLKLFDKYHAIVSYIEGLNKWYGEEKQREAMMIVPYKTPSVALLDNRVLDQYFDENKERLTSEIRLYSLIGEKQLKEDDILRFKFAIRDRLIASIEKECEDFALADYLMGTKYGYLKSDYSDISRLIPKIDLMSDCFLHLRQGGVAIDSTLEKTVFINTQNQSKRNQWRNEYVRYFSSAVGDGFIASKFKLIELQVQNLERSQVEMLN